MKRKENPKNNEEKVADRKKAKSPSQAVVSSKPGIDAIDSIFSEKKKKKKEEQTAAAQEAKNKKTKRPGGNIPKEMGETSILEHAFSRPGTDWVDDGLGGKFNREGFTGRVEDGVKVFKAHVLNKPSAGSTKDCPFDCDCCFI